MAGSNAGIWTADETAPGRWPCADGACPSQESLGDILEQDMGTA